MCYFGYLGDFNGERNDGEFIGRQAIFLTNEISVAQGVRD